MLANSPDHEHANYYRDFLNALRPNLLGELSEAAERSQDAGEWEHAQDILLAARGLAPQDATPRYALARFYGRRWMHANKAGNREEAFSFSRAAEAAYNELLSEDEAPNQAWFDAGKFRYQFGAYARAAETLETFLQGENLKEEQRQEALRLVRLCRDEGQADSLYEEAYAALTAGRIQEGVAMAKDFRDRRPEGWPGWFLLGWGLRLAEQWTEAREALEGARDRGCSEGDLFNELAICTRAMGDYGASASALEEALKRDPENIKIISNMALVRMEQGQREDAIRWLQTALAMEPGDPICTQLLAEIESE